MTSRICLIRCPQVSMPYPPDLGLGYIHAVLKQAGYAVRVLDINWDMYRTADGSTRDGWLWRGGNSKGHLDEAGLSLLHGARERILGELEALIGEGYNVFGFSVWNSNWESSLQLARWIKERFADAVIVFGGPDCQPSVAGNVLARDGCADAIVYGEGEETMVELMRSLDETGALRPCAGAYVRSEGRMDMGPRRDSPEPERLPYPDYSDYRGRHEVDGRISITFNRGCVRKCRFCSVSRRIPRFRSRSAESILGEIKHQSRRYGSREFFESSPAMNSDIREFQRLCELIARESLDIQWQGFASFNGALTGGTIKNMRAAGCFACGFGVESGSQKILDAMGKRFTVEEAERVLRECSAAGIRTFIGLIVGFFGETEKDFMETMSFLERNAGHISEIGSITPLHIEPHSPILEERSPEVVNIDDSTGWYLRDMSNTPAIREERAARLTELARSLGLFSQRLPKRQKADAS